MRREAIRVATLAHDGVARRTCRSTTRAWYREGHRLADRAAAGAGSTEDLRQAMVHYRALFEELVEDTSDAPLARDTTRADAKASDRQRVRQPISDPADGRFRVPQTVEPRLHAVHRVI